MYRKVMRLNQTEASTIIVSMNQANETILQNANLNMRQMDLKERARLMRELYPELSKLIDVMVQDYLDSHIYFNENLVGVREIVRRYENYPGMIGEAFMSIFLDGIEEELK